MSSKRSQEGYLLIDNSVSPGVPDETVLQLGLPPGSGRGVFEAPTITCSHCQTVVVINPMRTRDRGYCGKCDHYLCDVCTGVLAQSGICKTFKQVIDEVCEAVVKSSQPIIVS